MEDKTFKEENMNNCELDDGQLDPTIEQSNEDVNEDAQIEQSNNEATIEQSNEDVCDLEEQSTDESVNEDADVDCETKEESEINELLNAKKNKKDKELSRKKSIKRILKIVSTCLVWIICSTLLYICFSNLYQRIYNKDGYTGFFDVGQAIVASDSMVPVMTKNDLIFYQGVSEDVELTEGNIVVYKTRQNDDEILIVHRIIEIDEDDVVTQGDANAQSDRPINKSQIVGKYLFRIPMIGLLLNLLNNKFAPIAFIILLIIIFSIRIFIYLSRKDALLKNMSKNESTRNAVNHFFDV